MGYFRNINYLISHCFLLIFIYLFIVHRFSRVKTVMICLCAFLMLTATDVLKLNLFPDSKLCYAAVTVFQIVVTQATGLMIARERNGKVLFLGLSASNYVIAGSIMASVLQICTKKEGLALTGSLLVQPYAAVGAESENTAPWRAALFRDDTLNCVKEYEAERRCVEAKIHCVAAKIHCVADHLLLHIENCAAGRSGLTGKPACP